ncbi:hypothetical protein HY407_01505 [Candidatus Gottesmanbacteria bacterium]|nr:hypothetical protein [Candidatus Gottesmanbacteria bacterium]
MVATEVFRPETGDESAEAERVRKAALEAKEQDVKGPPLPRSPLVNPMTVFESTSGFELLRQARKVLRDSMSQQEILAEEDLKRAEQHRRETDPAWMKAE